MGTELQRPDLWQYATVVSASALRSTGWQEDKSGSIEIWVKPTRWNSATFLSLYRAESGHLVELRQSLRDLEVCSTARRTEKHEVRNQFYLDEAFGPALHENKFVLITVTFGLLGTNVYLDGTLARVLPHFPIDATAIKGKVILGGAPRQPDSFQGRIHGPAIYDAELRSSEVLRHYRTWLRGGSPNITREEDNLALYLFDERKGDRIRNHARTECCDLNIPQHYEVVDKILLEPAWKEFELSRSYWAGNIKNIIGFIPFGFCLFAYLKTVHDITRAGLVTIVLGAVVSLTIEVLQAFPTRDSGTTDLITNTLGTYIGVICFRNTYPVRSKMLLCMPGLGSRET